MFSFLPAPLLFLLSFFFYTINTLFWLIPIVLFSFLKALVPISGWQKLFSYLLDQMASCWVSVNTFNQNLFTRVKYKVSGIDGLTKNDWYLVLSNHQSWVDILVLQRLLNGRVPFLKFFLKKELIYVPFLGLAWWALDFPFMKRYSQAFLKKNPHLIGKDIETTRKACEKFKHKPVCVMNFIEGTRLTKEKYAKQKPPFENLLRPKAGGVAYVLDAMGQHLTKIINVTIYYPQGIPSFGDFISGRVREIDVNVEVMDIPADIIGDYFNDKPFKQNFQSWINKLWQDKDKTLAGMIADRK